MHTNHFSKIKPWINWNPIYCEFIIFLLVQIFMVFDGIITINIWCTTKNIGYKRTNKYQKHIQMSMQSDANIKMNETTINWPWNLVPKICTNLTSLIQHLSILNVTVGGQGCSVWTGYTVYKMF